ncbi:MAG: DUF4340 domain-containing protein [Candidatus Anammoxibacter sp.]
MNNKKLIILGAITVCMIIWAVVQSSISNKPGGVSNAVSYLIQGLDPDDISAIVIGTGDDAVTLKRDENHFVVVNKDGYPAISSEINNLINSCLDVRTIELYTDNPDNFEDLGVNEEDAANVVKFLKNDSSVLTGIIVGNKKDNGEGTFVRMASSNKVYVALQTPFINTEALHYVDQELTSVNQDEVESVTVSSSNETYTLLEEKENKNIVLVDIPEGKKLKKDVAADIFGALSNLRFNDVKKAASIDTELVFDKQFACKLKDSTLYTIKIAQKDEITYIKCESEFTDKTPVVKEEGVESEEELEKKEAKLLANDKSEEFQAKHNGWVYEISEYNVKNLIIELSGLLNDIDNEDDDSEQSTEEPESMPLDDNHDHP